jgi:hypothetical protein
VACGRDTSTRKILIEGTWELSVYLKGSLANEPPSPISIALSGSHQLPGSSFFPGSHQLPCSLFFPSPINSLALFIPWLTSTELLGYYFCPLPAINSLAPLSSQINSLAPLFLPDQLLGSNSSLPGIAVFPIILKHSLISFKLLILSICMYSEVICSIGIYST